MGRAGTVMIDTEVSMKHTLPLVDSLRLEYPMGWRCATRSERKTSRFTLEVRESDRGTKTQNASCHGFDMGTVSESGMSGYAVFGTLRIRDCVLSWDYSVSNQPMGYPRTD